MRKGLEERKVFFAKGLDKTIISPVKPVLVKLFESVITVPILDYNPHFSGHFNLPKSLH